MNKRTVVAICIAVSLLSFLGGVVYEYKEITPQIEQQRVDYDAIIKKQQAEYDSLMVQFHSFFVVPVDINLACRWLDWATEQYQCQIDNRIFTEHESLEFYQDGIDMFDSIRAILQEFEVEHLGE